jgi:hypothetical protein
MDWATRKVLSWRLSNTMDVAFCVEAPEEAMACFGKPDIFNTDQGSQFTSSGFTAVLSAAGVLQHDVLDGLCPDGGEAGDRAHAGGSTRAGEDGSARKARAIGWCASCHPGSPLAIVISNRPYGAGIIEIRAIHNNNG